MPSRRVSWGSVAWLVLAAACQPAGTSAPSTPTPAPVAGTLRWELPLPGGLPLAVAPDARGLPFLYVATKEGGLSVLRRNGTSAPVVVATVGISALGGLHATALLQRGTVLYLGIGDFFSSQGSRTGLITLDVSDPTSPRVTARWISSTVMSGTTALVASGSRLFLAAKRHGVLAFDISRSDTTPLLATILPDPNFPKPNPSATEHPNARGLAVDGTRLFVANDAGGLRIVDIADLGAPVELGRFINPGVRNKPQAYNSVQVANGRAYLAVDYCGLEIVDVTTPSTPRLLGWWNPWSCESASNIWLNSGGHTNQLHFDAARQLVYLSAGASQLVAVDVSAPGQPTLRGQFLSADPDQGAWGLASSTDETWLTYITAVVPFRGTWAGIRAINPIR